MDNQIDEEKPVKGGALAQMREEDNRNIKEFLDTLVGTPNLEITLTRLKPEVWEGKDIKGTVDRFEEPFTEDQIREKHGGGTYKIFVRAPNGNGGRKSISTTRIFVLSGPPKPEGVGYAKSGEDESRQPASVVHQAFDAMKATMRDAQARTERIEREMRSSSGPDTEVIQMMMGPLQEQLRAMAEEKRDMERRMLTMMNTKPDNSFQERMLEKLSDQDGARIEALRSQHYSEVREIRETHKQDTNRLHDAYKEQLHSIERAHQQIVDNIKLTYESRIETLKSSYELRIESLKGDVNRAERDLSKTEVEAAALRAKKEKSIGEQLADIAELKENFDAVMGKEEPEEEKKDFMEKLMDNPLTQAVAQRIATGSPEAPPQPSAQQTGPSPEQQYQQAVVAASQKIPVGKAFRLKGDTQAWMKMANGQIVPVSLKTPKATTSARPADASPPPTDIGVAPEDLAMAVSFIESAIQAGTSPQEFAASAATMVPVGVKKALREHGSDWLLSEVIKPGEISPLATQRGKLWFREVAAELLKGTP